jgi:hypothetical protein
MRWSRCQGCTHWRNRMGSHHWQRTSAARIRENEEWTQTRLSSVTLARMAVNYDWSLRDDRFTKNSTTWTMKIYQLNVHTIRVIDPSKLEMEPLSSQPNGFDYSTNASTSKSRASDAMADIQLGKRAREEWRMISLSKSHLGWVNDERTICDWLILYNIWYDADWASEPGNRWNRSILPSR